MKRTSLMWLSALLLAAMLLAACASTGAQETEAPGTEPTAVMTEEPAEPATSEGMLPAVDPAEYSGEIVTAGSSTVFPLSERMAELWEDEGGPTVTVDSIGSGAGFERFCVNAETDISNASRPIDDDEVNACRENGREVIEFRVGTDALAIAVSSENDFLENLTLEQLALAFTTAQTWADIDPSWPAETIRRFSPGTDSGTYDYFVEEVLDGNQDPILNASNIQFSEDDNVLVQGVEGSPYAIGYFGYAYYQENTSRLKALSVEGVSPTAETAESGEYPLARPLFIYSAKEILQEKPQVAAFINYYLTYVNEEILDVGYFPASVEALDQAKQNWLDATGE
ncbi:MAG TPA: PstS family phosphate ABC transporter substrate-binding protein [Anaerolineales bacterium]